MVTGEGSRRSVLQEAESVFRRAARQGTEKAFYNCISSIPRQLVGGAQHARYHLKFQNKICHPLHTFRKIEGEAGSDVEITLFDNDTKVIVTSYPLSSIKVEIVVLNGDFNNDDRETWSEEEFNKRIALPRDNRGQLLKGERFIKLNNGVGSLGDIVFTDNSSSQKTKKFRLGVRNAQSAPNGERIQEGITEPFRVKDRRVELFQKNHTPSLDDEVWRLKYIAKDGKFHKSLQEFGITMVKDFLRYYNLDEGRLRNILGSRMPKRYWKEIVKHAKECDLGDKLCSFSMRENSVVLFFNSIYRLVGVKFGDCYTTLDNLDTSQQDLVESWKNLAYGNINGMQFDHRMINGNPMPLLSSDTFLLGPSSLPHFQIINYDQVYSQVGLPQETSIADKNSRDLFMEHTSIDLDNHQTEQYTLIAETSNLPLEMGNSSFDNITTSALNSEFPGLPVTHNASEACYGTQPYSVGIESLEQSRTTVKDVSLERDNSLVSTLPMEITPTGDTFFNPQICECQLVNYDTSHEQGTQMCSQNQVELSPFMESLRVQPTFSRMNSLDLSASLGGETSRSFSRMSSFDPSSCEGLIQTFVNNLPISSGGETSRSIAPLSPRPRWVTLLAPIKWVRFTKKRRASILIHQTLVATG